MMKSFLITALLAIAIVAAEAHAVAPPQFPEHRIAIAEGPVDGQYVREMLWVDSSRRLWVSACPACSWTLQQPTHNGVPTSIVGGISTVHQSPSVVESWVIGQNGRLYIRYAWGGAWYWQDHGTAPCGTLAGNPATSSWGETQNGYLGGMMKCWNGDLVERFWDNASWQWLWINHGRPQGVTFASDPSLASGSVFTGAAIESTSGDMWILEKQSRYFPGVWSNAGNPGLPFYASPDLYTLREGTVGGLVTTLDGRIFHFRRFSFWGLFFWSWFASSPSNCDSFGELTLVHDEGYYPDIMRAVSTCAGRPAFAQASILDSGGPTWSTPFEVDAQHFYPWGAFDAAPFPTRFDDYVLHFANSFAVEWTSYGGQYWQPVY